MDILVKGRNIPVTEALERYATEKVERVAQFFDEERSASRAEVELIHERNRAIPEPEVAEATSVYQRVCAEGQRGLGGHVRLHRPDVGQARAAGQTLQGAPDRPLAGPAEEYAGRAASRGAQPFVVEEEEEIEPRIVRTKQFQMKPMGAEEAVLQLELLDHDFYVFTSADTGDINVVYRRRDGDYGLIEPAR